MTTQAPKSAPVTVAGKIITGQQIAAFKTSTANAGENMTVYANACAIQLYQGNRNWINDLFALPTMRLANGKLSAMGKNVLAYIKAHAPRVHYNSAKGLVVFSDAKALGKAFTVTGGGAPLLDSSGEPTMDFPIGYTDFLNWSKPKQEKAPVSLKAATVSGQINKALAELTAGNFAATAEEAGALAAELAELMAKVAALHAKKEAAKPAESQGVDAAMVEKLANPGAKGKNTRAGGKVAAVA